MDRDRGLIGPRDRSDGGRRLVLIVAMAFVAGACTGSNNAALARAVRLDRWPGPATRRSRPPERVSICSSGTGPRPRSTWRAWICGPRSCWWTRRRATPTGSARTSFALDYDRDRIRDAVDARDLVRINAEIGAIQAAAAAAERLRVTLADLQPLG